MAKQLDLSYAKYTFIEGHEGQDKVVVNWKNIYIIKGDISLI